MRLVKLRTEKGSIFVNPEHVVAVHKSLRNTTIETLAGPQQVLDVPEAVARQLLGEDEPVDSAPEGTGARVQPRSP